jgi:hypothetical protein
MIQEGTLGFVPKGVLYQWYELVKVTEIIDTLQLGVFFWARYIETPHKQIIVCEKTFIVATPVEIAQYRCHGSGSLDFRQKPNW